MITRDNYEAYFLDYHEGTLSEIQREELLSFLADHPDLKEELERFVHVVIEPANELKFEGKDRLKKSSVHLNNYKSWFAAYHEGDLNADERKAVEQFIESNPSYRREFEIFPLTRIVPDSGIVFENKSVLRRGAKVITFSKTFYRSIAVAASIILALVSYYLFKQQQHEKSMMADQKRAPAVQMPSERPAEKNISPSATAPSPVQKSEKQNRVRPSLHEIAPSFATNSNRWKGKLQPVESFQEQTQENPVAQQAPSVNTEKQQTAPVLQQIPLTVPPTANSLIAENVSSAATSPEDGVKLAEIFNASDMQELGLTGRSNEEKKTTLWSLAQEGASKLGKATGTNIDLNKHQDVIEDATTYALAIGPFSVSHTSVK